MNIPALDKGTAASNSLLDGAAPDTLDSSAFPLAAPIADAVALTGLSRSGLYRAAGRGEIVLLKHGRSTLVWMPSVRTYLVSLPRAEIRRPKTKPTGTAGKGVA